MSHLLLITLLILKQGYCYFVDEKTACNSVASAGGTLGYTYFGKFNSTQECINACVAKKCDSYTYYLPAMNSSTSQQCYGYINNTMWLPYSSPQSNCGRVIYPCASDWDCSLNGACNTNTGNCTCRKGWNGYKCHFMSLLPANRSAGYLSPFGSYNQTSW